MQFHINHINLEVEVKGAGIPLILCHGVGGNHAQMDVIAEPLSQIFKVITPDARGHGNSDKPSGYTLTDHTNDILGIMDHFQLESIYLLGISMGSYIAKQVAFTVPDRIKRLILTVPKSNGITSSLDRIIKAHHYDLIGMSHHEIALKLLPHLAYNQKRMLEHIDIFETTLNQEQFAAANKALAGFDFRKGLPAISAETLVISGKHDELNPPEWGRECADLIPNASFVEMPYSGHVPMYEEPEAYLKLVTDFLRQ